MIDLTQIDHETNGKETLINCPYCFHHKKKLSINFEKAVFQCWVCGEKGNLNKLAEKLGVENIYMENQTEKEAEEVILFNPGSQKAIDYLRGRAITEKFDVGFDDYGNAILFPYYGPITGQLVAVKYKYLNKNSYAPYRLAGKHPGMYAPIINQFSSVDSTVNKLLLLEGEMDSISAAQYLIELNKVNEMAVAATTGITNRGCVQYITDRFTEIYIAFDNESDIKLRERVAAAQKSLIAEIREKVPNARIFIVEMPANCKDMNDYLKAGNTAANFLNTLCSAKEYTEDRTYTTAIELFSDMEAYLGNKTQSKGLPTFIDGIDEALGGGKRLGEITALHAQAKTGKNCLLHKMLHTWLEMNIPIGYASRELTPETEVLPNILSIHFQESWWDLYHKGLITEEKRAQAVQKTKDWPLFFAKGYGVFEFEALRNWVKDMKYNKNINYFFIDHLHYLLYNSEDVKEISVFCRSLKQLVKEENIHVDIIIQPRKLMDNQRLNLDSLRGGAAIGQAIDNLFTMERVVGVRNINKVTLEVARHKLAIAGKSVYLKYDSKTTDMSEVLLVEEEKQDESDREFQPIKAKSLNKTLDL